MEEVLVSLVTTITEKSGKELVKVRKEIAILSVQKVTFDSFQSEEWTQHSLVVSSI